MPSRLQAQLRDIITFDAVILRLIFLQRLRLTERFSYSTLFNVTGKSIVTFLLIKLFLLTVSTFASEKVWRSHCNFWVEIRTLRIINKLKPKENRTIVVLYLFKTWLINKIMWRTVLVKNTFSTIEKRKEGSAMSKMSN